MRRATGPPMGPGDRPGADVSSLGPREAARRILAYRRMHEAGGIRWGEVNHPRWQPSQADIDEELATLENMRGCKRAYQEKYDALAAAHAQRGDDDDLDDVA
jgi:hypothetical protein